MAKTPEDALLEERIQKIRRNNEKIQRRHLEVEADKLVAAKSHALVQLSPPPDNEDPPYQPPKDVKKRSRGNREDIRHIEHVGNIGDERFQKPNRRSSAAPFSEGDGPPPDPKYNFLADDLRDPKPRLGGGPNQRGNRSDYGQYYPRDRERSRGVKNEFGRGRGRGHSSELPYQHAYEVWKTERHQIDQERINRQKTAGGEWRREWDKEKISQDLVNEWSHGTSQGNTTWTDTQYNKPYRRDGNILEAYIPKDTSAGVQRTKSPGSGGETRGAAQRNRDNIRGRKMDISSNAPLDQGVNIVSKFPKPTMNERIVTNLGASLQVSVPNEKIAAPQVHRVKVTGRNVAGTGRVGPRQQVRMSYSSQSEDETVSRAESGRKLPIKKYTKKPNFNSNGGKETATESKGAASETKEKSILKPPLPPNSDSKVGHDIPKPKRQRAKFVKQKNMHNQNDSKVVGTDSSKESTEETRDRSESGDDVWEDVTTTSGTESISEDLVPGNVEIVIAGDSTCNFSSRSDNENVAGIIQADALPESKINNGNNELNLNANEQIKQEISNDILQSSENLCQNSSSVPDVENAETVSGQLNDELEDKTLMNSDVPANVGTNVNSEPAPQSKLSDKLEEHPVEVNVPTKEVVAAGIKLADKVSGSSESHTAVDNAPDLPNVSINDTEHNAPEKGENIELS